MSDRGEILPSDLQFRAKRLTDLEIEWLADLETTMLPEQGFLVTCSQAAEMARECIESRKALRTHGPAARSKTAHKCHLFYTNNDNGVWLGCGCGWRHNLGFHCSAADAAKIESNHERSTD